ncbi:hypothetical protein [uncultured Methanomethylovorans sp.]|uniref:hypothetical protein n=1 Tax=uncultured Methanomethylovorans sp. TaxID=183759 RepID=UPI00263A2746|nr:hypothetical protein [uncultured Methanomethylovorans sp.]
MLIMEDTNIESAGNFSVFHHRMKDWEIVSVPIVAIVIAEILLYMGKHQAGIFLHVMIPWAWPFHRCGCGNPM